MPLSFSLHINHINIDSKKTYFCASLGSQTNTHQEISPFATVQTNIIEPAFASFESPSEMQSAFEDKSTLKAITPALPIPAWEPVFTTTAQSEIVPKDKKVEEDFSDRLIDFDDDDVTLSNTCVINPIVGHLLMSVNLRFFHTCYSN